MVTFWGSRVAKATCTIAVWCHWIWIPSLSAWHVWRSRTITRWWWQLSIVQPTELKWNRCRLWFESVIRNINSIVCFCSQNCSKGIHLPVIESLLNLKSIYRRCCVAKFGHVCWMSLRTIATKQSINLRPHQLTVKSTWIFQGNGWK